MKDNDVIVDTALGEVPAFIAPFMNMILVVQTTRDWKFSAKLVGYQAGFLYFENRSGVLTIHKLEDLSYMRLPRKQVI